MNNQFTFSFQTGKSLVLIDTYDKDGLHYLLSSAWVPSLVFISNTTTLLIQDDNSDFVKDFKKDPWAHDFFFTTPTRNLKFVPNFHKLICGDGSSGMVHGLLIKDNNQVTKKEIGAKERFNQITFKVISENKVKGAAKGDYSHELAIEPLDLEVEGLPPVTKLTFNFYHLVPGQARHPDTTGLEKTWLYNHPMLSESVGKTFTMRVGRINISDLPKGNFSCLEFWSVGKQGNFDLNSFQEKSVGNNQMPKFTPDKNPSQNNFSSANSNTLKNALIVVGFIVGGLILIIFISVLLKKKAKK